MLGRARPSPGEGKALREAQVKAIRQVEGGWLIGGGKVYSGRAGEGVLGWSRPRSGPKTKVRAEQGLSECTTGFSDQTRDLIGKIADVEHDLPLSN